MSLTDEEIEQRIKAYQEGDSNDREIDGLLEIIRELQEERRQRGQQPATGSKRSYTPDPKKGKKT